MHAISRQCTARSRQISTARRELARACFGVIAASLRAKPRDYTKLARLREPFHPGEYLRPVVALEWLKACCTDMITWMSNVYMQSMSHLRQVTGDH